MKCEKHNVDMYWKGDLRSGSMHCDTCELVTGTVSFETKAKALAGEFTISRPLFPQGIGGPNDPGAAPDPRIVSKPIHAPTGHGTVDPHMFNDEVSFRRARFDAANRALMNWNTGGSATCEYCGQYDGPGHMNHHGCEQAYWADEKFLRARGIRI